jgi:hypothetical protein
MERLWPGLTQHEPSTKAPGITTDGIMGSIGAMDTESLGDGVGCLLATQDGIVVKHFFPNRYRLNRPEKHLGGF